MIIVGISGPSSTGKTTLARLVESNESSFNVPLHVSRDLKDVTWEDILATTKNFTQYDEIYADKDYLLVFCHRVLSKYKDFISKVRYEAPDESVAIVDTTHLDLLIYTYLQFWYHYPSFDVLTDLVTQIMQMDGCLNHIYMTQAYDSMYDPLKSKTLRQRSADFKRNRGLELMTYELFSRLPSVTKLSYSSETSLPMILRDLGERYGVIKDV